MEKKLNFLAKNKYTSLNTTDISMDIKNKVKNKKTKTKKPFVSLLKEEDKAEIRNPERIKNYYRNKRIKQIKTMAIDTLCILLLVFIIISFTTALVRKIKMGLKQGDGNFLRYKNRRRRYNLNREVVTYNNAQYYLINTTFGNNYIDKKFLVIRHHGFKNINIISDFINNIEWVKYALQYEYIPIIDMVNYENLFLNKKIDDTKKNPWEFFFKQPFEYTLKKINNAKNILLTDEIDELIEKPKININFLENKKLIENYHNIYNNYFNLNDTINLEINKKIEELFQNNDMNNVICVNSKRNDFRKKNKINKEKINEMVKKVKYYKENNKIKMIYLVTDDEKIINLYQNEFKKELKISPMTIRKKNKKWIENVKNIEENKNDLISVIILSKCKNVISTINPEIIAASIMTNGYNYIKYYQP